MKIYDFRGNPEEGFYGVLFFPLSQVVNFGRNIASEAVRAVSSIPKALRGLMKPAE